tara:strand:+ start:2698 stop:3219 length:522 start_codon:yes stop_codon:yes gene_type:complete
MPQAQEEPFKAHYLSGVNLYDPKKVQYASKRNNLEPSYLLEKVSTNDLSNEEIIEIFNISQNNVNQYRNDFEKVEYWKHKHYPYLVVPYNKYDNWVQSSGYTGDQDPYQILRWAEKNRVKLPDELIKIEFEPEFTEKRGIRRLSGGKRKTRKTRKQNRKSKRKRKNRKSKRKN